MTERGLIQLTVKGATHGGGRSMRLLVSSPTVETQEEENTSAQLDSSILYIYGSLPTVKRGLLLIINIIKIISHRHAQRFIFQVVLDSVKLAVDTN